MSPSQPKVETTRFVSLATYAENRPVEGGVVTVLDSTHEARGLKLMATYSRALPRFSIHELIVTDEAGRQPGGGADHIAYVAFFEVLQGGCVLVGDRCLAGDRELGTVAGFDETHEPNHLNIVLEADRRLTGRALGLAVGTGIRFVRT